MKTLIKLLLAAMVLHASVRAGQSAWRYLQFKDAVEQEARFGARLADEDLHSRILEVAEEQGIPLGYDDVAVQRHGDRTSVSAAYSEPITLVPGVYTREQLFEIELSVRVVRPLTADDMK